MEEEEFEDVMSTIIIGVSAMIVLVLICLISFCIFVKWKTKQNAILTDTDKV